MSQTLENEARPPLMEKMDEEALPKIEIDMKLATRILQEESLKGPKGKNVVCSPLSLEFALHMVAAGSKGETLSQILQFIGLKGSTLEVLNLKSCSITRAASSYISNKSPRKKQYYDEEEPELSFANGLWVEKYYKLKPSYQKLMNSIYNAKVEAVDFGEQVEEDINSWVEDNTKGLIKEIFVTGSLNPDTQLILVNALYFKGLWNCHSQFEEYMTKDRDFHLLDGSKVLVPFMTSSEPRYLYGAFDDFKVLQLNYMRGDDKLRNFCMQILLPNDRDGLHKLVDKCISDTGIFHQDFGLKYEKLNRLWIPKFKFTYMLNDVSGMMKSLGLTEPFMRNCQDLSEMVQLAPGDNLFISRILHKATIGIDEAGTEAAAITEVELNCGCSLDFVPPPPPKAEFVAEHPFIFMIKEVKTGTIFFTGAVFNPLLEA